MCQVPPVPEWNLVLDKSGQMPVASRTPMKPRFLSGIRPSSPEKAVQAIMGAPLAHAQVAIDAMEADLRRATSRTQFKWLLEQERKVPRATLNGQIKQQLCELAWVTALCMSGWLRSTQWGGSWMACQWRERVPRAGSGSGGVTAIC